MRRISGAVMVSMALVLAAIPRLIVLPDPTEDNVLSAIQQSVAHPPSAPGPPLSYLRNPLVFLSTAPPDSLVLLPGIGPVLAERIAEARSGKRSFIGWEDLLAVDGIGPKKLERLRALVD